MKKLTARQQKFADYYIECGNASEAAKRAGYKGKYSATNTDKLLNNTNVKAYINEQMDKLQKDSIASADEVLQYLTRVMRNEEIEEVVAVESVGRGMTEAVKVTKHVSVKDRNKAAELLAKRYGLNIVNIQSDNQLDINILYGAPPPADDGDNDA